MSSITRITTSKGESEQASEERRLEMQRRMQLHARGKSSLSLSSLEELAGSEQNRVQAGRKRLGLPFLHGNGRADEPLLEEFANDLASFHGAGTRSAAHAVMVDSDLGHGASQKGKASASEDVSAAAGKVVSARQRTTAHDAVQRERPRGFQKPPLATNAFEAASLPDPVFHQANAHDSSCASDTVRWKQGVAAELDRVLRDIQTVTSRTGPKEADLLEAFHRMAALPSAPAGCTFNAVEARQVQGRFRFLNAFINSLPDSNDSKCEAGLILERTYRKMFLETQLSESLTKTENAAVKSDLRVEEEHLTEQTQTSTANDLNALYAYLEAVATAARSDSASTLIRRLDKLSQYKPAEAFARLIATGGVNETVSLVAAETERRFQALASCIEKQGEHLLHSAALKTAFLAESARVNHALAKFEEVASYKGASRLAEQKKEAVRVETTLTQIILQKA